MTGPVDEFSLINQIRSRAIRSQQTLLGIGDDAGWVSVVGGRGVLMAVDVLTEGVHFDFEATDPESVGRKALAVNLSDIAAMAGRPTAAVVGLVLPKDRAQRLSERVMAGLLQLAQEYDVAVVGGDTNTWGGPLVISVTVLGEPTGDRIVTRSGARPGDQIFVTGALGGSLSARHLNFSPRVREARRLHTTVDLHAMIDVSDGIASDIRHIARESDVGLTLDAAAIPIHDDVDPSLPPEQRLLHALGDGEDFELLFTVSEEDGRRLIDHCPLDVPVTRIGEITTEAGCRLRLPDGRIEPLPAGGWVHGVDSD